MLEAKTHTKKRKQLRFISGYHKPQVACVKFLSHDKSKNQPCAPRLMSRTLDHPHEKRRDKIKPHHRQHREDIGRHGDDREQAKHRDRTPHQNRIMLRQRRIAAHSAGVINRQSPKMINGNARINPASSKILNSTANQVDRARAPPPVRNRLAAIFRYPKKRQAKRNKTEKYEK